MSCKRQQLPAIARERSPPFWNVRFQTLSAAGRHLGNLCKVASGEKTSKKLQTGKKDLVLETQMKRWKARLDILLHLCGTHFKDRETNRENQVRIIQKSFPSHVEPSLHFSFKISFCNDICNLCAQSHFKSVIWPKLPGFISSTILE